MNVGIAVQETDADPKQVLPLPLKSREPRHSAIGCPIDINAFLQQCMGDSEFALRLLDSFTNSAADRIRELSGASDAAALRELAPMAHAIKGVSGIFVAQKLHELCRALEVAAVAGDLAGSRQLVGSLCDEIRRFTDYVSRIRNTLCGS